MNPRIIATAMLLVPILAVAVPTASAYCNIYYNATTGDCVNGGPSSTTLPSTCSGAPCGSPCVLDTCVTRATYDAYCVEFSLQRGNIFGEACVPTIPLF